MIDPATGRLTFVLPGVVLGPELSRQAFLDTPYGASCPVGVRNEPWCSFALLGVPWEGHIFNGHIYFRRSRLEFMNWAISFQDPSIADLSEADMVPLYDTILDRILRPGWPQRKFPWGSISTGYDRKADSSMITVRYDDSAGNPGCLGMLAVMLGRSA